MDNENEDPLDVILNAEVMNVQEFPVGSDQFLIESVLNLAELGAEVPLTLNVQGLTISGICIGSHEYMNQMLGVFKRVYWEVGEDVSQALIDRAKKHYPSSEEVLRKGQITKHYVHLADARIVSPGGEPIPGNEGVLWRGKISSVDGFFIGQMAVNRS